MTTQLAWTVESRERVGAAMPGRRVGGERAWRSHTFADGVRSLTLTGPLDVGAAGRLWARLSELLERGCRRLIVDARAIAPTGDEPVLLAGVFADQPPSCDAVVVVSGGSALADLLPASVGVTRSLNDAHARLAHGIARRDVRHRMGPAGRIPERERHTLAIRQSLRWAARSAREGDYERALEWLAMVERIDGALPEPWSTRREAWLAAWKAQASARHTPPRPGPDA